MNDELENLLGVIEEPAEIECHDFMITTKLTPKTLAALLTGREIGNEITEVEEQLAKDSDLVVVFGASDDLVELRGAINDEVGAYNGTTLEIDVDGLLPNRDDIDSDDELEKFFARRKKKHSTIDALWCKEGNYSWTFHTPIPNETFEIIEDGEQYCRGIVFKLGDA